MSGLTTVDALPILLVDDRAENLQALEAVLEPLGYPLETATSGSSALRRLLERDYGLILLDVRMPGLDGLETAALIKGRARSRDIPIVFLTAARNELGDIIRGYGVGAIDYVLKPFDPELLRSKVAVFAELEANRRALKRSEAFLRGAFEAAPIGKTVLDSERRIVRANPAFARLLRRDLNSLTGIAVAEVTHEEDRELLLGALAEVSETGAAEAARRPVRVDIRLSTSMGTEVWVEAVLSEIEAGEYDPPQLLVQWIDLTARRRVEQARGELLMEQAARAQAEATAERLTTLQAFSDALDSLSLDELLSEVAVRLADLFHVELAEVEVIDAEGETRSVQRGPAQARHPGPSASGDASQLEPDGAGGSGRRHELPLYSQRTRIGDLRLTLPEQRNLGPAEVSLLREVGERAALSIRRAQLHEEERRIAEELQRGLLPKRLPDVGGLELAAHYQAAGLRAEAGGDWYDAFALSGGRVGIVVGDVTGRGIKAASTMGQLRSVTRAFALVDDGARLPGDVLIRLNRYQLALAELEMFTVIYAVVDPVEGCVRWANAGHPPPLLRAGNGEASYLGAGNELMGIEDVAYETNEAALGEGDTLILYSDGLVERRCESLDLGLDRLAQAASSGPEPAESLCGHLLTRMLPEGSDLHDDVTAMLVRVLPSRTFRS